MHLYRNAKRRMKEERERNSYLKTRSSVTNETKTGRPILCAEHHVNIFDENCGRNHELRTSLQSSKQERVREKRWKIGDGKIMRLLCFRILYASVFTLRFQCTFNRTLWQKKKYWWWRMGEEKENARKIHWNRRSFCHLKESIDFFLSDHNLIKHIGDRMWNMSMGLDISTFQSKKTQTYTKKMEIKLVEFLFSCRLWIQSLEHLIHLYINRRLELS